MVDPALAYTHWSAISPGDASGSNLGWLNCCTAKAKTTINLKRVAGNKTHDGPIRLGDAIECV
jgi:hypothetical protein